MATRLVTGYDQLCHGDVTAILWARSIEHIGSNSSTWLYKILNVHTFMKGYISGVNKFLLQSSIESWYLFPDYFLYHCQIG